MIYQFESKDKLEDALVTDLLCHLEKAIALNGSASILLSGGSTPKALYSKLSRKKIPWSKVTIGLVDERFVNEFSEYSNEKLIRETLLQNEAKDALFIPMVYDENDEIKNIELVRKAYATFDRLDAIILGMGEDGHTASIFPDDEASDLAHHTNEFIVSTKAPNHPIHRITCSIKFLDNAEKTYLFFTGEKKLKVLEESKDRNYPIAHFNNQNTDIYYAN